MAISKQSRFIRGSVIAVVIVYLAACIAPAVGLGPQTLDDSFPYGNNCGMFAFFAGMFGLMKSIFNPSDCTRLANFIAFIWTANPFGLTALILIGYRQWEMAILTGGIAFGLSLLYLIAANLDSVGHQPLFGVYLWSASMAMILRSAVIGYWVYDVPIEGPNPISDPIESRS